MPSERFFRTIAATALLVAGSTTCPTVVLGDDELKIIAPENAAAHATETVIVEFTVRNSNLIKDRNGKDVVFLNSMKDFKHNDNFTVVIFADTLAKFREQDIDDPSKHYRDKTVRVTGGVELRRGKAQIILKDPEKITLVEAGEAERKKAA